MVKHPSIRYIQRFDEEITTADKGAMVYNLLLELQNSPRFDQEVQTVRGCLNPASPLYEDNSGRASTHTQMWLR